MKHFPRYNAYRWNAFDEQSLDIADRWIPLGFVPPMRYHRTHWAFSWPTHR